MAGSQGVRELEKRRGKEENHILNIKYLFLDFIYPCIQSPIF
jgi:hypothetical protein